MLKPNGLALYYDLSELGTKKDNIITIPVTGNMTSRYGRIECDFEFINADGDILYTTPFYIRVTRSPVQNDTLVDKEDYNAWANILTQWETIKRELEAIIGALENQGAVIPVKQSDFDSFDKEERKKKVYLVYPDDLSTDGVIMYQGHSYGRDLAKYLSIDNVSEYTPIGDYNPATKKYVDDNKAHDYLPTDFDFTKQDIKKYSPTKDSHPATKKYVDDSLDGISADWYGTQAEYEIAISSGEITEGMIVCITDDYENPIFVIDTSLSETSTNAIQNAAVTQGIRLERERAESVEATFLSKTNTTPYAPSYDYNPSTKKYVDDKVSEIDTSNFLAKDNIIAYSPTSDYNPATKKYVDSKEPSIATSSKVGTVKPDGTTITIDLDGTLHGSSTVDIATTTSVGTVKPDGTTIKITPDGTISSSATSITVDSDLSTTSENPVQNKTITTKINSMITYGTTDLIEGTSPLSSGSIYVVYE